jgi:hypothetical protein
MHTSASIVDLRFISLYTINGRSQIRRQLEEEFNVHPSVVDWFFQSLEQRQDQTQLPTQEIATSHNANFLLFEQGSWKKNLAAP